MAINPSSRYPGKIRSADTAYPFGSARNVTTPGDGSGTPWDENLINDMWGLFQKLLQTSAITPSGDPDTVQASQYFDALQGVAGTKRSFVSGSSLLALTAKDAGYVFMQGGEFTAPSARLPPAASAASAMFVFVATNQSGETPEILTQNGEKIIGRNALTQPGGDSNIYLAPGTSRSLASNGTAWYEVSGAEATEREVGPVRYATAAEVGAGAGAGAVSPFSFMQQFIGAGKRSFATPGYQRLPGGLILQWARQQSLNASGGGQSTSYAFAYPVAYTVAPLATVVSLTGPASHWLNVSGFEPANATTYRVSTSATISGITFNMFSLGY